MKDFTSRVPLPITALALAWVVLGSTFQGVIPFLSDMSMIISFILIVLTVLKFIFDTKNFCKGLTSPVGLSLFCTFSMTLMVLAVWMKDAFSDINIYVWTAGVIMHTILMIIFTLKYVLNFRLKYVFPSWFLVYTGIGIAAITCKDFGMIVFGKAVLHFIIAISIALTPFILIRVCQRKSTNAAKPIVSMLAIPLAVILPAYVAVSETINEQALWIMFILIQVILVLVTVHMVLRMFHGFYPSWATYATSLTMSLYASRTFEQYLISIKSVNMIITYLLYFEFVFVFVVATLILLAYFINALEDPAEHKKRIYERMLDQKFEKKNKSKSRRRSKTDEKEESTKKNKNSKRTEKKNSENKPLFAEEEDIIDLID